MDIDFVLMLEKNILYITQAIFRMKYSFNHCRAQPDWVEEAGEHPPLITEDQIPKAGVLPKFSVSAIAGSGAPKPFTLKKESTKTISPGNQEQSEKLTGGKEKLKLSKPNKDNE